MHVRFAVLLSSASGHISPTVSVELGASRSTQSSQIESTLERELCCHLRGYFALAQPFFESIALPSSDFPSPTIILSATFHPQLEQSCLNLNGTDTDG